MRHIATMTRPLPALAQTDYEPPLPFYMTEEFKTNWYHFWNSWVLVTEGAYSIAAALATKNTR